MPSWRDEDRGLAAPIITHMDAMMIPVRLQRTKANRTLPVDATYVGRGSKWANPFRSPRFGHARSIGLHRAWLEGRLTIGVLARMGFNQSEVDALLRRRRFLLR